jgi:hypothetical protein
MPFPSFTDKSDRNQIVENLQIASGPQDRLPDAGPADKTASQTLK